MNLLKAALYDPAAAVSKATSALLAMTAFDTTNLRLAITVPAHGMVRFRLRCVITGATTVPTIFLGVLNGATVIGRVIPQFGPFTANVLTQDFHCDAEFTVSGLTPGAMNVDAAYGVEVVVAATNIKYGGPNNTTTNDAWGGFVFEAWDPQPLKPALDGGVNVTQFGGAAGTFSGGRPEVNTSHAAGTAWASGAITAASIATGAVTAAKFAAGAIDAAAIADNAIDAGALAADCITAAKIANGAIDAATFAAGAIDATAIATDAIGAAEFAQAAADKVWATAARALTDKTGFGVSSLAADTITAASIQAAAITSSEAPALANLDATVSSRLATAGYTAPLDAAGTRAAVGLATANLDTQLGALPTILSRTDVATSTRAAPGDAMTLSAGAVDSIWDEVIESGKTGRELQRLFAAALLGKVSGMNLNAPAFRDLGDTKDRIAATCDADGNRTAVTLDAA